jgi:hypothetical protein
MTLVTEILARAARQCSVNPPSSWLTAADQTSLEVLDFLGETIDDILDRVDVVGPVSKTYVVTGDGGEDYTLPADMARLHRGKYAVYERLRTRRDCIPVPDDGTWEYMKELGTAGAYRFYRLQGYAGAYTMGFYRPLEASVTVVVNYVSTAWIINGGTQKSDFTAPEDNCLIPRKAVELGIVWRFRRRKGLEYTDMQNEYEIELAKLSNDTRTRRSVSFGAVPLRNPWDVPIPDYIPDA